MIHLFGMVGVRRVVARTGYRPVGWEQAGYWLCWAVILVFGVLVIWKAAL